MTRWTGRLGRRIAGGVAPLLFGLLAIGCGERDASAQAAAQTVPAPAPTPPRVPIATIEVVARHPHDPAAFTQGLLWHRGRLYESTGQPGASGIRRVRLETGVVEAEARIPSPQFGEGLTLSRGELVSLTWRDGIGYRWNPRTLRRLGTFAYTGEGWGLASDGRRLILSDGTPTLRFLDPGNFRETGRITVTINGRPLGLLNELEWVDGEVWANVWHRDTIARIDPATGRVTGVIDLRPLAAEVNAADPQAVLNGIAWDAERRRLFVTGKYWPTLFEVRAVER